ncbi:MAG TPA: CRTAC1 family protein [Planctomycetota bacterium]|nr:CRTAC1 family protein [Planctomycetota bacterium]
MRRASFLLLGALGGCADEPPPVFRDVAQEAGLDLRTLCGDPEKPYIVDSLGTGAAFLDFDLDGRPDAFLANGSRLRGFPPGEEPRPRFYRNTGEGRFVAAVVGLERPAWWQGCAAGDFDNDGDPDLLVTSLEGPVLWRNLQGSFGDATAPAGVAHRAWGTSASFADLDADGDLDLYVCGYVRFELERTPKGCPWKGVRTFCGPLGLPPEADRYFRNEGDGTFVEASAAAGLAVPDPAYGLGVVASDLDQDGAPDLYVANDSAGNFLFWNRGDGTFEEGALFAGTAYSRDGVPQSGMGVDAGDADGDGDFELFVTNFESDHSTLYRNLGARRFEDVSSEADLEAPTFLMLKWGTRFFDFDHDGDLDLFEANGHVYPQVDAVPGLSYRQRNQLFRNDGGKFVEVGGTSGPAFAVAEGNRAAAFADLEGDGDLDVLVTRIDGLPALLRNDGASRLPWIRLRLDGRRSNRFGYGALCLLRTGGREQRREARSDGSFFAASEPVVHFGLGGSAAADEIEVRWPSGQVDRAPRLPAFRLYRVVEGEGFHPVSGADRSD